jgi:hypothetical protein
MAAYVLGARVWVIERRARVIWMREGTVGAKGRMTHEELATEADARARFDAIVKERIAEGFVLVDAKRSIDAPLYGKPGAKKKETSIPKGLDVAELHALLAKSSCDTIGAWLARFAEITSTACVWRLLRVSCAIAADGAEFELEATFGKGTGSNPDAYDEDGYRVYIISDSLTRDDLEDRVDLDVFADELGRISQTKMVGLFRRAVEDLSSFAVVRDARVISAEVERTP